MSFPTVYREIREMVKKTVLQTRHARDIARKAGLRGTPGPPPPRTIIDAYIDPFEQPLARQYIADFSSVSQVRLSSASSIPVYVFASADVSTTRLDPIDYAPLSCTDVDDNPVLLSASSLGSEFTSGWLNLSDEQKIPLRLTLSAQTNAVGIDPAAFDGSFSVSMQVK